MKSKSQTRVLLGRRVMFPHSIPGPGTGLQVAAATDKLIQTGAAWRRNQGTSELPGLQLASGPQRLPLTSPRDGQLLLAEASPGGRRGEARRVVGATPLRPRLRGGPPPHSPARAGRTPSASQGGRPRHRWRRGLDTASSAPVQSCSSLRFFTPWLSPARTRRLPLA